jgi:hypothetical protein
VGFNDFASRYPELASEADGWDPESVTFGSKKKLSWKCHLGHRWIAQVKDRVKAGCPICSGNQVLAGFNDLASTNPELAEEWHPTKNGDKTPSQVKWGSGVKVWWICKKENHEWKASIASRNKGRGCPICSGNQVLAGFNDLATTNPELAEEWHPTKNGDKTPSQVKWGSPAKVWWICKRENHEWKASIASRNNGTGCPSCAQFGFNPSRPAWLYLLEHDQWDLYQIGITNNRDQRTGMHLSRQWALVDLRGPMDGNLCKQIEQSVIASLKRRGAKFANFTDIERFDGWTEAWTRESYQATSIKDLMTIMYQDDELRT